MANLFLARDQTAHTNLFKVNVMSDKKCFKREFEQLKKDFRRRSWQNLFLARGQTADPNPSKKQTWAKTFPN